MSTIKNFLKENVWVILLATLVGIIIVAPVIIFKFNPNFRGVDLFATDGEPSYIAQIHAVYNGNFSFGNVFLHEYQDQPYVKQQLPAIVTAAVGKLFGLYVPNATILAKFVFPFITFILVYLFAFYLTKRRDVSLLGALFVLLSPGTTALFDPRAWLSILRDGSFFGVDPQFLVYSRPISPQVSNVIFFAYLALLWRLLTDAGDMSKRSRTLTMVASGVILGLSFYTYLFSYTLLFAMNGLLFLFFAFKRDRVRAEQIFYVTLGGLVVGTPYFLNMFRVFASPYYADLNLRVGQVRTHEPVLSRVWFGIVLVYAIFYRKMDSFGIFLTTFLAAAFVVSNQQIITGKTIPIPEHYHWYYLAPLTGFALIYIFFSYCEKKRVNAQFLRAMAALLFILFIGAGVLFQAWCYREQKDLFISKQRFAPTLKWLAENTTKDDVVFSNETLSVQIVTYAPASVYYNAYAGDAILPVERLRQAFYTYMYLNGVTAEQAEDYFSKDENRAYFSNRIFGNYYRAKCGLYECYPKELDAQFIAEFKQFANTPFVTDLKKYKIDYAVWDKLTEPNWKLDRFFGSPIFESDDIAIYKVT